MKKSLLLFIFVLLALTCSAVSFGNETKSVSIEAGSLEMMTEPQLDSTFFLKYRMIDANTMSLNNYHSSIKIYDHRGVLIYPYLCGVGCPREHFEFSDSNGFVSFAVPISSCNLFSDLTNCFQLDLNYTVEIAGKDLFRKEYFVPRLKQIQTNWIGDFYRFFYTNITAILLIFLCLVVIVFLASMFYIKRGGKRGR